VTEHLIRQRLADVREFVGMSVAAAAEAADLSAEDLVAIERGLREVDDLELQRLARAYGVRGPYFTEPEDSRCDEAVIVLGRLAGELTGGDRDEALRFAAYLRHAVTD
jgi:transcriptional regulator with XRE-family HTH domain